MKLHGKDCKAIIEFMKTQDNIDHYMYRMEMSDAIVLFKKAIEKVEAELSFTLQDVADDPKSFTLILSGHNDHPACNGKYSCSGEKENGKYKWTHKNSGGVKLFWTGGSWDCFWGGYSPESSANTQVPPESGYNKDQGGCDIKVRY
jgi:hypothetical protein